MIAFLAVTLVFALPTVLHAAGPFATNITADGTLGTVVLPSGNVVEISGGTIKGSNQFHSFGRFDLGTGDVANFGGAASVQNILGRVTGGFPSHIDGTISSSIDGANLFLMNPSGLVLGPNAFLDLSGSFFGTTSDYIGLNDGQRFTGMPSADDALLSSAAPAAFGFLNANPAPIEVQSGVFDFDAFGFSNALLLSEGKTLGFVGGDIRVGAEPGGLGGFLFAPGGRIDLASVASTGEAQFGDASSGIDLSSFAALGNVALTDGSILDGREIYISGGQLTIQDATIFPGLGYLFGLPFPEPDGGVVDIDVRGDVIMTTEFGGLDRSGIQVIGGDRGDLLAGDTPNVAIRSGTLTMDNGAIIQDSRYMLGEAPAVEIDASAVSLSGGANIGVFNYVEGSGGSLTLNVGTLTISNEDGSPPTGLFAESDFHPLYGDFFIPQLQFADSASITVNATESVTMLGSAEIGAESFAFGRGGSISVNAPVMNLIGAGAETGQIASQSILAGEAGSVELNASNSEIQLQDGFRVSTTTFGSGDGGTVAVSTGATGSLNLTGSDSRFLSATAQAPDETYDDFALAFKVELGVDDYASLRDKLGVEPGQGDLMEVLEILGTREDGDGNPLVATTDFTEGDAGRIEVSTGTLILNADTRILTSTGWDGNAGSVVANVGSLGLHDGAAIRSQSGIERLDGSFVVGSGNAGSVTVTASDPGTISVTGRSPTTGDGSSVSTSTFGAGAGGEVLLVAPHIAISDGGQVSAFTEGEGNAGQVTLQASGADGVLVTGSGSTVSTSTFGSGAGGAISIEGPDVSVTDGGQVAAVSRGSGNAGQVNITASDASTLSVSGTGSTVSTSAFSSGDGGAIFLEGPKVTISDGGRVTADSAGSGLTGNITISAGNEIQMDKGSISTSAATSDGGNIELLAPNLVYLLKSEVSTSVESGVGGGGNILVDPEFVVLNDSDIIANAFGGPGGNIRIVAGNFVPSVDSVVEASSQLGVQGTIVIASPENNIAGQIALLPSAYLSTNDLLPERCAARRSGSESSFVISGDGGLPTDPDGYLPSFDAFENIPARADGSAYVDPSEEADYPRVQGVMLAMLDSGCN